MVPAAGEGPALQPVRPAGAGRRSEMSWKGARQGAPQVREALAPGTAEPRGEQLSSGGGRGRLWGLCAATPSHGEQKDCLAAGDTAWICSLPMGFRLISTQDLTGGAACWDTGEEGRGPVHLRDGEVEHPGRGDDNQLLS